MLGSLAGIAEIGKEALKDAEHRRSSRVPNTGGTEG